MTCSALTNKSPVAPDDLSAVVNDSRRPARSFVHGRPRFLSWMTWLVTRTAWLRTWMTALRTWMTRHRSLMMRLRSWSARLCEWAAGLHSGMARLHPRMMRCRRWGVNAVHMVATFHPNQMISCFSGKRSSGHKSFQDLVKEFVTLYLKESAHCVRMGFLCRYRKAKGLFLWAL